MSHEDGSEPDGHNPAPLETSQLPEFNLDIRGSETALEDATSCLKASVQLIIVTESLPDPEAEVEAVRLYNRAMAIKETLDDVIPKTDGKTWSFLIPDKERDDSLSNMSTSNAGIRTALFKAAQTQASARTIEITVESGDTGTLLEYYGKSEAELASLPQHLMAMVGVVTETLDHVVPRSDGEAWAVLVDKQAQYLLDNS